MNHYWHTPEFLIPPPPPPLQVRISKCNPYEREQIPNFCHVIQLTDMWVSNALEEVFDRWCVCQPVGIFAPTGKGKTTFVRSIVRHCSGHGKVLYLAHRAMISSQQKKVLCRGLKSEWSTVNDLHAFELMDHFEDIGLSVMSYQKFAARHYEMDLSQFSWVIFDECHFFYSDALFNLYSDDLLNRLPQLFRHAHRIYMTATPGAVLPEISRVEGGSMRICGITYRSCYRESCGQMLCYFFPEDFSFVKLSFFKERQEIVDLVVEHPNDKFLIFTSNREDGATPPEKSYRKLLESAGVTVTYLDRYTKQTEAWVSLCENERFQTQTLVCTSVLDCGVNIRDDALRHIVIESTDKTEFLQMLGRKRRKSGEQIQVYVRVPTVSTLHFRLHNVNEWLGIIDDAENATTNEEYSRIFKRGWYDESPGNPYPHLLAPRQNGRTKVKETAHHALLRQQAILEKILNNQAVHGDSAFPIIVLGWLRKEENCSDITWLGTTQQETVRAKLISILSEAEGKELSGNTWEKIFSQIKQLIGDLLQKPHDTDRSLQHRAINNRLHDLNIPFSIEQPRASTYIIKCIDEIGGVCLD